MAQPPRFWAHGQGGLAAALLSPAGLVAARITARRVARPGWRAPVPVLCCGNAGVGGAGKTTLALDLGARLQARGVRVAFLSRGHGGRARGSLRVDPAVHDARAVGDEALLLAACAPCWVGADRGASARLAVADGAQVLVLDDGLQNPTLVQDCGLLVIDGAAGFGNGRVLPAGPLREPVQAAARRCRAAVLIGPDETGALGRLPPGLTVLRASLVPDAAVASLAGRRVLAVAGIGRPEKFFAMLRAAGVVVVAATSLPDHHAFRRGELAAIQARANVLDAQPVTTPKDAARMTPDERGGFLVLGVGLGWEDPSALEALLESDRLCPSKTEPKNSVA